MTDSNVELIPLREGEFTALYNSGVQLDCVFGTGGTALKWDTSLPMPDAVRQLGLMRGVFNQNMDGAGI